MSTGFIDTLRQSSAEEASRLLENALRSGTPPLESLAGTAVRLLRDRRVGDPILAHLSLAALERLAESCIEELSSGKSEVRAAWELLDVARRPAVRRRIVEEGVVDEWSDRILRLIDASNFTFGRLFAQNAAAYGSKTLFRLPGRRTGEAISWDDASARMGQIARGLLALMGEEATRPVAILSENRLAAALLDLACLANGIVDVLIPSNATDKDVAYMLRHAGVGAVVVSTRQQMQKVLMHREEVPDLRTIVALDGDAVAQGAVPFHEVLESASRVPVEALESRRDRVRVGDLATVMYTSGTTGVPKGIMFSHRNIVFKRYARALALPEIGEDDRFLCYLPLFHTFGRFLELGGCVFWGSTYCFAENPAIETLIRQMQEARPTVFISIPMKWMELYESIRQQVDVDTADDTTILNVTRRLTGGQLRWGLSAAGYLDPDIFRFFQRQGIELLSGFGMTEATGGVTMTPPGRYKDHSLGKALPGIELRIADDGELKIRGPYVMMGYLDPPDDETSFDEEGWLPSGDIMEMDEEGFICLVDRKKEIYKNIKGQTIAPQRIENLFRDFESVGRIFLVGDHRPYNTALIYPNPEFKELDLTGLARDELKAHFRSLVVSANSFVEPYERIVDFAVIERGFDAARGELTPKGTYRRAVIERNFASVIELLYRRTTLSVGEVKLTIPNWFFQKLGITTEDLRVEGDRLQLTSAGTSLTVRKAGPGQSQVGSVVYRQGEAPLDLGVLLRTPSLWLGNEELISFAPLDLRHRHRRLQVPEALEWLYRVGSFEGTDSDRKGGEALLSKRELDLIDLHRVATLLEASESADAVLAVRVLENVLSLEEGHVKDAALRILRRASLSAHPEVLRQAFRVLTQAEQEQFYRDTLSSFLDNAVLLLDPDTTSTLAERNLSSERLDAFVRETEERCLGTKSASARWETQKALLDFLSDFGRVHPSRYHGLRGILTRISMEAAGEELKRYAATACERLTAGFRAWLGPVSRIAVDPDTGREYRWEDVVDFADDVDEDARRRLLAAFKSTAVLREAIFLFSTGTVIRLDDILPKGVWVRLVGSDRGKSVYRVAVKTRLHGQFDLAVNLNRDLLPEAVKEEIEWLILCGESLQRRPVVESFGGYWPEQDLWTEEFIAGETLDRALRRLSRQKHEEERFLGIWPYAAWSAVSAHVDLWIRTGAADPSAANVIVPMHDYHTGARLVSITGRRPFRSLTELLQSLKEEIVLPVEKEHPRLQGGVGWDIILSAVLEVAGEREGVELLRTVLGELKGKDSEELRASMQRFLASVGERGFLPMRLYFAAKRYRRWARLNSDATLLARARTLQEMYDTYNLGLLQTAYPESRARFFQETVFRHAEGALAEGLKNIIQRLRQRDMTPEGLSFAVADLRARLKLSGDEDYFLTRLSYPYLRPEDDAEYIPAEVGGSQQSEMVVTLQDADGNPYRVRHAVSPKEVGRLHRLFLAAKLPVQFRPDHRFLVAVNDRGQLVGGLFYEVEPEARTAYMDKVVVAERFQRKGVAGALLEELANRLKTAGYRSLTTGFFRPQFFYRYGFTVERNYAGLVRSLEEETESSG